MSVFSALAIASVGSAVISGIGQVKAGGAEKAAGRAQREAAESQAELAEYNANVAELQAADAIARGTETEQRFREEVRGIIGAQRAGFAASGVDVGFGSSLDVQADAAFLGERDALQIRTNAAREAWGFKVEAEDLRRRATIARKEGVYAERAGRSRATQSYLGAAGSVLGAGESLLRMRYGFRNSTE